MKGARDSDGFVLVNVLVIVLALSVLAMQLLGDAGRSQGQIALMRSADQMALDARAGERFAMALLAADRGSPALDHRGEAWALTGYRAELDGGAVTVTVTDLEARVNLNLLATDDAEAVAEVLARLLRETGAPDGALDALWARFAALRSGGVSLPRDQLDAFRPGDLSVVEELAALPPLASAEAADARKHLAALPRARGINVNTASGEVLAALTGLDAAGAAALLARRETVPFASVADFAAVVAGLTGDPRPEALPRDLLDVASDWFLVETETERDGLTLRGATVLYRDQSTGEMRIHARQTEVTG